MTTSNNNAKTAFETLVMGGLNIDSYDLDKLASWCQKAWPQSPMAREFKEQLHAAVTHPGQVTPQIYESWTADDSYPTQEKLQDHLKEVWNACFPNEKLP